MAPLFSTVEAIHLIACGAQVIGTFCGVIAAFNPEKTVFHRTMDDLNRFMRREDM